MISPDKTPKLKTSSPKVSDSQKELPKKICSLCNGAGCCTLCDRPDAWDTMMYCSNRRIRVHLVHYSCDNLSKELQRPIVKYYCPTCRLDPKNKITFKKETSAAKRAEILGILNSKSEISINIHKTSDNLVVSEQCDTQDTQNTSKSSGGSDLDTSLSSESSFNGFVEKLADTPKSLDHEDCKNNESLSKNTDDDEFDDDEESRYKSTTQTVIVVNNQSSETEKSSTVEKNSKSPDISNTAMSSSRDNENKSNIEGGGRPDHDSSSTSISSVDSNKIKIINLPRPFSNPDLSTSNKTVNTLKNNDELDEDEQSRSLLDSFREEFPGQNHRQRPNTPVSPKKSSVQLYTFLGMI